jgi:hypothetical protein
MKESVAIAKEANRKKESSPTRSDNSIQSLRNEPERQLGSLRDVIGNIQRNGGTPSVESISTELSVMPSSDRASALLALQQTHGNRYVQRVVTGIQAKLKVGQLDDKEEEEEKIQTKKLPCQTPSVTTNEELRRQSEEEEEEEILQAKALPSQLPDLTPNLEARINAIKGGGQPLPKPEVSFFESRLGYDFSRVRLHTDAQAAESAQMVNALAYTVGRDVVFGAGQYAPSTAKGKQLLAHELIHVIQQVQRSPLSRSATSAIITGSNQLIQRRILIGSDEMDEDERNGFIQSVREQTLMARNRAHREVLLSHPRLTERILQEMSSESRDYSFCNQSELIAHLAEDIGETPTEEESRQLAEAEGEVLTPDEREAAMERFAREHHVPRSRVIWTPFGPQILLARVAPEEIPIEERTSAWTRRHWELMHRPRIRSEEIEEWGVGHTFEMEWERLTSSEGRSSSAADYKDRWVRAHRCIIRESAREYDLPAWLVAGVAWIEVGGEPGYTDDLSYILGDIGIRGRPELASFGPVAIQIRRAAEELGYDPNALSRVQTSFIISSLRDPQQNLFIVASHLHRLWNIDFPARPADMLTDDEIRIIATRYNRGPDLLLEAIQENTSYGDLIIRRKEALQRLLQD